MALRISEKAAREKERSMGPNARPFPKQKAGRRGTGWVLGLREPDTLAYALCDSPVGLLSMTCSALRARNPKHKLEKQDIVHVAQLAWLPGPEAGMRFWASAEGEVEALKRGMGRGMREGRKPKAVVTVSGDGEGEGYVCSAWAEENFHLVGTRKSSGGLGMVAWEGAEVVGNGVRALVKGLEGDSRLSPPLPLQSAVDNTVEADREIETRALN